MAKDIRIPLILWDQMMQIRDNKLTNGKLHKPLVFALYSKEQHQFEVIDFKEIPNITVTGTYPKGDYNYQYPGIKGLAFYPKPGSGKRFCGTLVIGDGLDIGEVDEKWIAKDNLNFMIKMDREVGGEWQSNACYIEFNNANLAFT